MESSMEWYSLSRIFLALVFLVCVFSVVCQNTLISATSHDAIVRRRGTENTNDYSVGPHVVLTGAAQDKLPRVTEDMALRAVRRMNLKSIPLISESDFFQLLTNGRADSSDPSKRAEAAELVALSNSKSALGVEGAIEYGAQVEGEVFLIARDPALTERGTIQSKSFYLSAVRLSGRVSWTVSNISLLFTNTSDQDLADGLQGCSPLSNGADGLPFDIILNLESGLRPTNASSQLIELRLFGDTNGVTENRFVCAGSVRIGDALSNQPRKVESLPAFKSAIKLPEDSVVISEADFYRILKERDNVSVSEKAKSIAARVIAAAREPSALGIQARLVRGGRCSSSLVVAARNPTVNGTTLHATQCYLAPGDFVGVAEWLGGMACLGFSREIPSFKFDVAPCGSLALHGREPNCKSGMCIGAPHPWMGLRGGFVIGNPTMRGGFDNGNPTVNRGFPTIRLFERVNGRWDINAIACTQFLSPPEREASQCGRTDAGGIAAEICNGRDDDCNGLVDEGGVCENLPMRCPAQPRTCGAITCGDIPNGVGGVLHCGGPCQ